MQQRLFEWPERDHEIPVEEIVFDPETIATVITQMATAMVAVVRGATSVEEASHDE